MKQPFRIFLIRHGQSLDNVKKNYEERIPDHLVPLTTEGEAEAHKLGERLAAYCHREAIGLSRARIWRSPFLRTRQTADLVNESLRIKDVREEVTLIEQQYGLFDALRKEEIAEKFPAEYAEYHRQIENGGRLYARLPLGESPLDVAVRLRPFIEDIRRDYERGDADTLFIVTHGTAMRAFLLRYMNYSPEWYQAEYTPANCSVRLIEENADKGFLSLPE